MPPEAAEAPEGAETAEAPEAPAASGGGGRPESFLEALNRHGGLGDDDPDAEGEAEATAEPPAPGKPAAKAAPATPEPADTREAKLEQLKGLAKELNMTLEDSTVSVEDRVKFRQATRAEKEKLESLRKEAEADISRQKQEWEAEKAKDQEVVAWANGLRDALKKSRDFDEAAKALEFESWDNMIEDSVMRFSDPNYQQLKELRQFQKEQREKEEKAAREAQERAEKEKTTKAAQEREQATKAARARWAQGLQDEMKASDDKFLREFATDPSVIGVIMSLQEKHFDRESRTTINLQQAVNMPLPNGKTLLQQVRENHAGAIKRAIGAFGEEIVPEEIRQKLGMQKPAPATKAPRTTSVPTKGAVVPSSAKPLDPRSPEWSRRFRNEMSKAIDNDERSNGRA